MAWRMGVAFLGQVSSCRKFLPLCALVKRSVTLSDETSCPHSDASASSPATKGSKKQQRPKGRERARERDIFFAQFKEIILSTVCVEDSVLWHLVFLNTVKSTLVVVSNLSLSLQILASAFSSSEVTLL